MFKNYKKKIKLKLLNCLIEELIKENENAKDKNNHKYNNYTIQYLKDTKYDVENETK